MPAAPDADRVRRQKRVLVAAVVGFLLISVVGLTSLVVVVMGRERARNREVARRAAAARAVDPSPAAGTSYRCEQARAAPRIDGVAETEIWDGAPVVAAAPGTRLRALWDERALYVFLEMEPLERKPDSGAPADLVAVRFDAEGSDSSGLELSAGPSGAAVEAPTGGASAGVAVQPVVKAVAGAGTGWGFEAAIPWPALGATQPEPGRSWRASVERAASSEAESAGRSALVLELAPVRPSS